MTYPVWYGGDLGNRIFVLYWRCPLIRVSVIRGSTVLTRVFIVHRRETVSLLKITFGRQSGVYGFRTSVKQVDTQQTFRRSRFSSQSECQRHRSDGLMPFS